MFLTIFLNEKTPIQAIKTRSLKNRKIDIFPKGLTHGIGPKMAIFLTFFLEAIQARKMSFTIFWDEKPSFQVIKTRSLRSEKNDIFLKGLTHGLNPKLDIFQTFFFEAMMARKIFFLPYSRRKKRLCNQKFTFFQTG